VNVDAIALRPRRATSRRHPVLSLAATEGRHMARHPLLLLAVVACLLFGLPWLHGEPAQNWSTQSYVDFGHVGIPVYFAAFVLGNLAALRERPSTTAEMFTGVPTSYAQRTRAILLAGVVPTAASVLVVTAYQALVIRAGGITVGDQVETVRLTPTVLELALVPAITATSFTAGVAFARTVRSRVTGVMIGTLLTGAFFVGYWLWSWFPAYFLAPYTSGLRRETSLGPALSTDEARATMLFGPDEYNTTWWVLVREADRVGWHIAYLLGVSLLLAEYALRRSGRDRRVPVLLTLGALLVVAGLVGQLAGHGGPFPWSGDLGAQ
jgi:hypothetical protein